MEQFIFLHQFVEQLKDALLHETHDKLQCAEQNVDHHGALHHYISVPACGSGQSGAGLVE